MPLQLLKSKTGRTLIDKLHPLVSDYSLGQSMDFVR
jgi:hypothetical protein